MRGEGGGEGAEGQKRGIWIPEKDAAVNGTGRAEESLGIRNPGPWRGSGKSIKRAGFPEAATPMPGQASHTSCGKRHPRVCSMLCFSRADGLLRSIYNFFRHDVCDPQKITFSEKREKQLSLGPWSLRIRVWN